MSLDFTTPTPLSEAVAHLSAKTPIGSILRTREWRDMPIALRNAAQFSAGVESVRLLQRVQSSLVDAVTLARNATRQDGTEPGTFKMNRQKFVADIRELGIKEGLLPPDDKDLGGLRDITSEARLDLIYRTQMGMANGHAYWKRGQDQDILDAWPAQELVRIRDAKVPRDWVSRWAEAGGQFTGGRMVALKTDLIWTRISEFGNPWPPFDFNSGMGLEEIDREEAIALGLLSPTESLEPVTEEFDANLQASTRGLGDDFKGVLKNFFGDQIRIDDDAIKWKGGVSDEQAARDIDESRSELNRTLESDSRDLGRIGSEVYRAGGSGDAGIALDPEGASAAGAEIAAAALGRKPLYHEQWTPEISAALAEQLRPKLPAAVEVRAQGAHLYVYRPEVAARVLGSSDRLFERIHELTERGANGRLLGYGATSGFRPDLAVVKIHDAETGDVVMSFFTEPDQASLFGRDRARDYALASGRQYDVRVRYPGREA